MQRTIKKYKGTLITILACLLLLLSWNLFIGFHSEAAEAVPGTAGGTFRTARVLDVGGEANITRDGDVFPVYKNLVIQTGDGIATGKNGYVDLLLDDDKYVTVEASTKISFELKGNRRKGAIRIGLQEGAVSNTIENPLAEEDSYEIVTPDAVMAVRGTRFRVYVAGTYYIDIPEEDGNYITNSRIAGLVRNGMLRMTNVTVYEGTVQAQLNNPAQDRTLIVAGNQAVIGGDLQTAGNNAFLYAGISIYDDRNVGEVLNSREGTAPRIGNGVEVGNTDNVAMTGTSEILWEERVRDAEERDRLQAEQDRRVEQQAAELAQRKAAEAERQRQAAAEAEAERQRQAAAEAEAERQRQAAAAWQRRAAEQQRYSSNVNVWNGNGGTFDAGGTSDSSGDQKENWNDVGTTEVDPESKTVRTD